MENGNKRIQINHLYTIYKCVCGCVCGCVGDLSIYISVYGVVL